MPTYAADMIDDLRDRLNDPTDTQVPFATKIRFLNRGQVAMYPKIFKIVRDSTTVLASNTFEYNLPSAVGTGKILTVEVETGNATLRYGPLARYEIIPSLTQPTLVIMATSLPSEIGAKIRVTTADRPAAFTAANYTAAGSDDYEGPFGTEELPVLYAMGLATARVVVGGPGDGA